MAAITDELREAFSSLRERIDSTLSRTRSPGRELASPGERAATTSLRPLFVGPEIDMEETDDAVIVRAELPGLSPEDFTVELTDRRLVIRGEKREERTEREGSFNVVERRYGSFMRSILLPQEVNPDGTEAEFKDGVLRLRLPKAGEGRRSKISVRAA
jgi:HSP20 family protein